MEDRKQIEKLYQDMYQAMVKKDRPLLEKVHDDDFVLYHMTGMKQNKEEYISSIMNGTLNYYSEKTDELKVTVDGDKAFMKGKSEVEAAVFGGGRHRWRLQLSFELIRRGDAWKILSSRASTY